MKHFLTFILVFTFANIIYSQGLIIDEKTQTYAFNFRYEEMSAPESLPNDIIHKMAMITAPTRDYFFGFTLFERSQIIKLKQNRYRISIKTDSINYYNKLSYMGYKLNSCVFPNQLNFNIQIENGNTGEEFLYTTNAPFSLDNSTLFDTIFTDTTGEGFFTLKNLQIKYIFTKEQALKLDSAISAINKLATLEPKLQKIKIKLQSLQNIKAGMVQLYNIDLKNIESELQNLDPNTLLSSDISIELKKEGSLALYDSLMVLTKKTRRRFDHMIAMPEYEYYSEGYHALQEGKTEVATSYFLKSISQKSDYPPPFYALAELAYQNQAWDSCAQTILHILNDLKPDFTTRKNTLLLGSKLYNTITYKAKSMILKSQINEAIKILHIANTLCNETHEMVCNGEADLLLKKAKSDLFYSWISITNQTILNNKVDLSLNYLTWTQDFYKNNSQYLSNTSEMDSLKIRLIHLLIINAAAKNNSGSYEKAMNYIHLADSLCAIINYYECESDLQEVKVKSYSGLYNNLMRKSQREISGSALKQEAETLKSEHPELVVSQTDSMNLEEAQIKYDNLIGEGLIFMHSGIFNKACQSFDEALDLEGMMPLEKNDSLSGYLKKATKPIILSDLKSGDLQAWGMHYQAVNSILKLAREEALKVGLENDSDIMEAISQLEKLAFENKCAEASTLYIKNLKTASENIRFKDFLSASENWDIAIELAHKNPQCNMDINMPLSRKQKYRKPIEYQTMISEAKELSSKGKDSLAFSVFINAYTQFIRDSLSSFGLSLISPVQFAEETHSAEMNYFALKWTLTNRKNEFLLVSIQNLVSAYETKRKYSALLLLAAEKQAQIDKQTGLSASPKVRGQKLFGENKDLIRKYVKSYRKS